MKPAGWALCKLLGAVRPSCRLGRLGGLRVRDIPAPELPGDDWVRVRTLLGGICGTDVALVAQKQPPDSILQAFSSLPAVLGHENVAVVETVGEDVDDGWLDRRVCVEPTLCCEVRGIDPPCDRCRAGEFGACENFGDDGNGTYQLPPGTSIGYNSRTGGSLGEQFVAHVSQLVPLPDSISDEVAVLTDPVACSLHAVLRADLSDCRRVLVYGAGVLGLGVIASLRAVGFSGRIDALDRSDFAGENVARMGGDTFLKLPADTQRRFDRIAELTDATVQRVRFGNRMLSGGYDAVFDCVGTQQSLEESLKWARARGQVVMVATAARERLDLTPIWFRELTILGAYGRQKEHHHGRRVGTYELVHEMLVAGKLPVEGLLTHTFTLDEFRRAMSVAMNKDRHNALKVAIDFR
ncbi:MAG: zinc-dependent alcohol dehydrogenase [Phycisphaerae bacterium]